MTMITKEQAQALNGHTPGPWRATSPDHPEQGVYGCGYRLAKMTGGEINRDMANAHLFAAAPDLLDTIIALHERVERLTEALIWCSGSADFGEGGIAREGWLKLCAPLLKEMTK